MRRFSLMATLSAVTLVAACGAETAAGRPPPARAAGESAAALAPRSETPVAVGDEEVVLLVFEAAADGAPDALPESLPPQVSPVRVGVVALHDVLLERRTPTPPLGALLDALDALAERPGGADEGRLASLVARWREWSEDDVRRETEIARQLSIATAAISLGALPGADGLADVADKAAEAGTPPDGSPAGAGILFVRYAALAAGEEGSNVTPAQNAAMGKARAAFDALGWPGGLALLAEPLSYELLQKDSAGMRGAVLWSTAADAYRASGDLLRSGMMYVRRAGHLWRGSADPEGARRAALMAETGRTRVEQSGARGRDLFEACTVHAAALQAMGEHEKALAAARDGLALRDEGDAAERADLTRIAALSELRLGRLEDCLRTAEGGLAALAEGPEIEGDRRGVIPILHELAGHAALRLSRWDVATRHLGDEVAFYERESGKPWAPTELLDAARLMRARALAKGGDTTAARVEVRAVLDSGPRAPRELALAADVLLDAGFVDDADEVVTQGERALGEERAAILGELRGRIQAARGDLEGARVAFRAAIDLVTGGDRTKKSLVAARVFESWARAEEAAGDPERAADLFQTAANHLVDIGVDAELRRVLAEVARLRGE